MDTLTPSLPGKQVLILGLGTSGLAMARWCARQGAHVCVADTRLDPPQRATLAQEYPEVVFHSGAQFDEALLRSAPFALVLLSPGLAPVETALIRAAALEHAIPQGNELSLFTQALADLQQSHAYAPKVICVTGTNGKTTVTALTGQLATRAGKNVAVAGNIGPTVLDTLAEKLNADNLPDIWVLELSSFQLEGLGDLWMVEGGGFAPTVATVLNISEDHLDWHGSLDAYVSAKKQIFGLGTHMLLNRDDPLCMAMLPQKLAVQPADQQAFSTFGSSQPTQPGDWGLENVNGVEWLVRAQLADTHEVTTPATRRTQKKRLDNLAIATPEISLTRLMPMQALQIHGRHNASNALAALALATVVGCGLASLLHGLREYRGEPHRVESVAIVDGVEFFDDSKGTNVGATVAALHGLAGHDGRKLVLILGGVGKDQDFSPLRQPIARHARAVVLIGRDAGLIASALQSTSQAVPVSPALHHAASMAEAVFVAARLARSGDAVLLSPACASFDMFNDYKHRAAVFCAAVREWALKKGAIA